MNQLESENIIILENTSTQERVKYFSQLVNFFKILVPYTRNVDSIPSKSKFRKRYPNLLNDSDIENALNCDPEKLAAHIQQLTFENILSDEALFDMIKQLHELLTTQKKLLMLLIDKCNKIYNHIPLSCNRTIIKEDLFILIPVKFAAEQRESIISDFLKEISLLYIELEKIVSPKTPLNDDQLSQKVNAILSKAATKAQETLNLAQPLEGVQKSIDLLNEEIKKLLSAENKTSELLDNALTSLEVNHYRDIYDLNKNYPDTNKAGSEVLSIMTDAYKAARGVIHEQKTIKENNEREPSRAFFPRPSIKLKLIKQKSNKHLSESNDEFIELKDIIYQKWVELKEEMDKYEQTEEFKQLEQSLKNINDDFSKTKNLFDLNRVFEPFFSCDLEALGSFNEKTEYLKQILRNFFNFIQNNISQQSAYAVDVFQERFKQFPIIISQVQKNFEELKSEGEVSINAETRTLYNNFIVQLKKEIINSAHNSIMCPALKNKKITPLQALDHLNSLCDSYPNNPTTPNLLIFVFNIITQLAVYYPQTVQPILLSLAHSVFESVDRNIKPHLEEARLWQSAQALAHHNVINNNSPAIREQTQEELSKKNADLKLTT